MGVVGGCTQPHLFYTRKLFHCHIPMIQEYAEHYLITRIVNAMITHIQKTCCLDLLSFSLCFYHNFIALVYYASYEANVSAVTNNADLSVVIM